MLEPGETPRASRRPLPSDIAAFRYTQDLARAAVHRVFERLVAGVTEQEAAAELRAELRREGVRAWMHPPLVWFGDRTCFNGFRTGLEFFPTRRALRHNDVLILDVGPVHDGFPGDFALAAVFGADPEFDKMKAFTEAFKARILALLDRDRTGATLIRAVNREMEDAGYDVCHTRYLGGILGHRVKRFAFGGRVAQGMPFPLPYLLMSGAQYMKGRLAWLNDSCWQALEGVWALEPHLGNGRFGAKFEELLWVHGEGAEWLM